MAATNQKQQTAPPPPAPSQSPQPQPHSSHTQSNTATPSTSSSPHPNPLAPIPIPPTFTRRKSTILAALALPDDEYTDLSPKGTVDAGIRDLIGEINGADGFVTTSSCAGRVSVFLEGRKGGGDYGSGGVAGSDGGGELPSHQVVDLGLDEEEDDAEVRPRGRTVGRGEASSVGGKGGGGRWLFVSHEAVPLQGKLDSEPNIVAALLGMEEPIFDGREGSAAVEMSGGEARLIHFKFEPMILHVLTASLQHAQLILRCGLQAGFRESGAVNLIPAGGSTATPIVAIRSMGLGLESLIGRETNGVKHCTVSDDYLKALIKIANERFVENGRRIERFRTLLRAAIEKQASVGRGKVRTGEGGRAWEDAEMRRERKRLEGLVRAEEVRRSKEEQRRQNDGVDGVGGLGGVRGVGIW